MKLGGDVSVLCTAGGVTGDSTSSSTARAGAGSSGSPAHADRAHRLERKTGQEYRFLPNGPTSGHRDRGLPRRRARDAGRLFRRERQRAARRARRHSCPHRRVAIAGGARFVLDSPASASGTLDRVPVYLVKPSIGELEALRAPARPGRGRGGGDGHRRGRAGGDRRRHHAPPAPPSHRDGLVRLKSPKVEVRSAVGAGDSFVGAMVVALGGRSIADAATFGVAAGAAAVMSEGTQPAGRATSTGSTTTCGRAARPAGPRRGSPVRRSLLWRRPAAADGSRKREKA